MKQLYLVAATLLAAATLRAGQPAPTPTPLPTYRELVEKVELLEYESQTHDLEDINRAIEAQDAEEAANE